VGEALVGALHVGLDDERQRLDVALGQLVEDVLELGRLLLGELHVAELALAEERDLARLALVGEDQDVVAGARHVLQALDLDRDRGPASFAAFPFSSFIARTRPKTAPASTMSPLCSVPDFTRIVATGPRPCPGATR
jgi:hypothetical protein